MSRTVTLPDNVYERLEVAARDHGLDSVEQLLERWPLVRADQSSLSAAELRRRQEVVDEIDAIQAEALAACGMMPDCVELIREDRER